jgi:hypothetical protein
MEENGWCHSMEMILVYASLATIDGFIALAAAIQVSHSSILCSLHVFSLSAFRAMKETAKYEGIS